MAKFMIEGGNRLEGRISVSGSKNASLPILAATLLFDGETIVHNVPNLRDIEVMCELLEHLGAKVKRENYTLKIDNKNLSSFEVSEKITRKMRASNLVLGPLLARYHKAKISYPGGCDIGSRPMDLHLKGLFSLGAEISERSGYIIAETKALKGADIVLDVPSVGATENIMMASVFAKGTTFIHNAAREPEIMDLQNFLNKMGAKIEGAGTDVIQIEGVASLKSTEYTVIPDRIEAGTHMIAAAITKGNVIIENVVAEHLESLISKLRESGIEVKIGDNWIQVVGNEKSEAVDIKTLFYPGFPTDLQPQLMALLTVAKGTSVVTEKVFENRYKHVNELRRMGADIVLEGQTAIVKGVKGLNGAIVEASDLRAGAALVLAALGAKNISIIESIEHIDRGYESLEKKYNLLGAKMTRVHR